MAKLLGYGRTTRTFENEGDVWSSLEKWAEANKYRIVESDQNSRTYTRRVWLLLNPLVSIVEVTRSGQTYTLESWAKFSKLTIFGWLMGSKELKLEGSKMMLGIPRYKMKMMTNELLESLGGSLIP